MVVAHLDIDYLASVTLGMALRVGIGLVRIGNKSLTLAFQIEALPDRRIMARGTSVMVAFDNAAQKSRPFPPDWREKIRRYEEQNGS
jgi:acyl-CoA thioester hydrolase